MEVKYPRCAGLDVHKETVMACARIAEGAAVRKEQRTFGTCTRDLLALADWLTFWKCTHVVMEATGVYWKPVWHVLDGGFELVLANARNVRNVPGRKTDVKDAAWLADLLAHGLVEGSFVPTGATAEARDLTRTRRQLVRQAGRHIQRIQKVLEDANIKLASVLSDIAGASGRAILAGLVAGESDPEKLANLVTARINASREELVESLRGKVTDHHRFQLRLHLDQVNQLQEAVRAVEDRLELVLRPFRSTVEQLVTIPGVQQTTAHALLGEVGPDVSSFRSAGHFVSWTGLCPRNDESASKRRSTRLRKGNRWLSSLLVQAAWSAVKDHDTYLYAQFVRLRARAGAKKAIVAVAASIATAIYRMLLDGTTYQELGTSYFDHRNKDRTTRRLVRRLKDLGYDVQLKPAA